MYSAEGEMVELSQSVDVEKPGNKGQVENWLVEVESSMMNTIKAKTNESIQDYEDTPRDKWCRQWPGQYSHFGFDCVISHGQYFRRILPLFTCKLRVKKAKTLSVTSYT